jgi:hypothetical protein
MSKVSVGGKPTAVVDKAEDRTVKIVVYGTKISNRLRGHGPGVPRGDAATAIAMVAQTTGYGSWPKGITPRIFGRALRTTFPNAVQGLSSEQIFAEMMEGWNDAAGTNVSSTSVSA